MKTEIASERLKSNNFALHRFSRRTDWMMSESKLNRNKPTPKISVPNAQTNWNRVSRGSCRSIVQNAALTGIPHKRAIHGPTKHTQRSAADAAASLMPNLTSNPLMNASPNIAREPLLSRNFPYAGGYLFRDQVTGEPGESDLINVTFPPPPPWTVSNEKKPIQ